MIINKVLIGAVIAFVIGFGVVVILTSCGKEYRCKLKCECVSDYGDSDNPGDSDNLGDVRNFRTEPVEKINEPIWMER